MAEETERPRIAAPIIENIPQELRDRSQWVVWRYEKRGDKDTKVPYTPFTTNKARSNTASTWRSFQAAHNCYLERPDFFDGIGFMFAKNDPYVGGDRDHCVVNGVIDAAALSLIPITYAEISPSGEGIKFIAKASGHYGRKTNRGELYSSGRFFTITGNVLAGRTFITDCQDAVDRFFASLGDASRPIRPGTPGNGSRAAHAAAVPEDDWKEGRRLLREDLNRLLARVRGSAAPKTQLWYVLRGDYDGLHAQYPGAGALRSDDSVDASQIRAIFANGMRMRKFTFSEFVALFYHFYGADCLAKWGTTKGFREEAATLWAMARTPRGAEAKPPLVEPAPRGRAGSRAKLLERCYQVLLNYKAGVSAIVTLGDVAKDLGVHPGTASRAIKELTGTRISTRKYGPYGGLIVDFLSPELITNQEASLTSGGNGTNQSAEDKQTKELIYENEQEHNIAVETHMPTANENTGELIYEMENGAHTSTNMLEGVREYEAPHIDRVLYKSDPVFLQQPTINSEKRANLRDAVTDAFDNLPKIRAVEATGEAKRWPVTNDRIIEYVQQHYAEQGWKVAAILDWAERIRKKRKAQTFDELKGLRRDALEKKAASVRKRIARAEEQSKTNAMPELRAWYAKQASSLNGQAALIAWELSRRDGLDAQRISEQGYSEGEQQEMLALIEKERRGTVSLPTQSNMAASLIANLQARKRQNE